MKTFFKFLWWFFFILCLVTPLSFLLSHCFAQPLSAILSAVWGVPCGYIAMKLVF